ncbi:MAG: GNAT family N-acetyltransferase [Candidatus Marinimicrobia bacterium]|nr:GNAT family N-acetyltransferase [Candidatus Neomarinimicrobiota bacterium]MCH8011233.1 GNAT family N-acetyltransferase [Candidatus Neomarinimicrobiota bacterium]MCH8068677.1 GNAT family N-acetyltransferase [Candidatus Neomarinimicrobiota bacterium]
MNFTIKEHRLKDAIAVSSQIPEFENPYGIDEYKKRFAGVAHHILTAYKDNQSVGFKIGYDRYHDGSLYSWMGGVIPKFRRFRVAELLADKQESWAKSKGYEAIILKTRKKYKAMLHFCEKRGFTIVETIQKLSDSETRIILKKLL